MSAPFNFGLLATVATVAAVAALLLAGWALVFRTTPTVGPQVGAIGVVLRGWRSPDWPVGVQEEDPEARWARRRPEAGHRGRRSGNLPARSGDLPDRSGDPGAGTLASGDEAASTSWIELLDGAPPLDRPRLEPVRRLD